MTENFWQERTIRLIGAEAAAQLAASRVLMVGLGGVGGFAAEHLVRCGVGRLTLVDGDTVDVTNCNRQLAALRSSVGQFKVVVLAGRFRDINPELEVTERPVFLRSAADFAALEPDRFDLVIDAIDEVSAKVELIEWACRHRLPLISSMGAAGKFDAAAIRISDISKTCGCPLARAVRRRLRERGIDRGVTVVFSSEAVQPGPDGEKPGSLSYLVAAFGAVCAQAALSRLLSLPPDR